MAGVKGMKGCGGRRPGSGRKSLPDGEKKVQVTVTITAAQRADMDYLRGRDINTNEILGRYLSELAARYRSVTIAESE